MSLLLTVVLCAAPGVARAQDGTMLTGVVQDGSQAVVPAATVVVRADQGGFDVVAETGADGRFRVPGLVPGAYMVTVVAPGFAAVTTATRLPADAALTVTLEPAPVVEQVRVVSASRQDELRQALNTRVDVVSRARIEESGAQTVAEVLRELPGVLTRRGSETAGAAGEQIQGIDSRQVLVLIDGQPLVGARGIKRGVVNLDRQSTARLERIEVVKGASSALYGSDAIGGVINLITRDASAPLELSVALSGGSLGEVNSRGSVAARGAGWSGLFTLEHHQQDGFDLTPTTFDTTGAPFERVDVMGKVSGSLADATTVEALVTAYRNTTTGRSTGELGPQSDDIRDHTINSGATLRWALAPALAVEARGYHARFGEDSSAALADGTPLEPGSLDERLTRLDTSVSWLAGSRQQLQAGVEWARDEYAGVNRIAFDDGVHQTTAVGWAQHRLSVADRVTTTLGLRVDHHSTFGTAVSPKVAANARLTDGVNVRASWGRGFRAPDLGQLYYRFLNPTNFYQVIGNPTLEPEYADSIQMGAELVSPGRRARLGINVFHNDVRDLIDSVSLGFIVTPAQLAAVLASEGLDPAFNPTLGRLLFTYKNVSNAVTRGVELDGELALTPHATVGGAYTYLDARDTDSDIALTGRHPHHGHVRFGWRSDRVGFSANLRGTFYSSWIVSHGTPDTVGEAFALWDLYLSQRVGAGLSAFAAVDNLGDSQDPNTGIVGANGSPAAIYRAEAGRAVRFGVRWTWTRQ
ncbi:MAG: TonB-dependent receptor [Vicinamibacterales bacterium]